MKTLAKRIIQAAMIAATLQLVACGGAGGSNGGGGGSAAVGGGYVVQSKTATEVSTDLYSTNLIQYAPAPLGSIKRWPVETSLIPIKTNGNLNAARAMDVIEATLGKTIFDRTSIANTAEDSITRGLVLNIEVTGAVPTGNQCGNVSTNKGSSGISAVPHTDGNGALNDRLFVNLGGSTSCSPVDDTLLIHEIGHALGMTGHFSGFGQDMELGSNYWNVLKSLYSNPIGATAPNLTVYTGVVQGSSTSGTAHPYVATAVTTVSFGSITLAGQTVSLTVDPDIFTGSFNTFTFASIGGTVRSGAQNGTFLVNSNGTLSLVFPSETLTYTLINVVSSGLSVSEVSSSAPGVVKGPYVMKFASAPVTSKPYTAAALYGKTLTAWIATSSTVSTSTAYAFAASGNTVTATTAGVSTAGTYTIETDGSLTITVNGSSINLLDLNDGFGRNDFTLSANPLLHRYCTVIIS